MQMRMVYIDLKREKMMYDVFGQGFRRRIFKTTRARKIIEKVFEGITIICMNCRKMN